MPLAWSPERPVPAPSATSLASTLRRFASGPSSSSGEAVSLCLRSSGETARGLYSLSKTFSALTGAARCFGGGKSPNSDMAADLCVKLYDYIGMLCVNNDHRSLVLPEIVVTARTPAPLPRQPDTPPGQRHRGWGWGGSFSRAGRRGHDSLIGERYDLWSRGKSRELRKAGSPTMPGDNQPCTCPHMNATSQEGAEVHRTQAQMHRTGDRIHVCPSND